MAGYYGPMPRATNTGIALLTAGTAALGSAYAAAIIGNAAPPWAPWAVAIGGSAASVSFFVLGAASRGPVRRSIGLLLGALLVVLIGSFGAALALPAGEGPGGTILLGLPSRLAIVFYGVGFVPLLALPLAFGLTFRPREGS